MFVDSHCHINMLDLSEYESTADFIAQTHAQGVDQMLCIATDLQNAEAVIKLAETFPSVYATVGVHPSDVTAPIDTAALTALAAHPRVLGIGETGLDYHYNETGLEVMRAAFVSHIEVAKSLNKPLIIHTRDAREDTLALMQSAGAEAVGGVMHCFTESWEMAEAALALGFYISISGIVTFKKAEQIKEVAKQVPLDRLLIETDSPFLAPVPYRGKQNQPAYVRYVAEEVAALRGMTVEAVAAQTTENFNRLFRPAGVSSKEAMPPATKSAQQ